MKKAYIKYIHQIVRKLKCSSDQKKEIKKQLEADILTAIEQGESLEDIKERIGVPAEIAEEFNSNFSELEKKKFKKEKRIKRWSFLGIFLIVFFAGIYWIYPKSVPIEKSSLFQKEEVIEKAKAMIELVNAEDYKTLQENAEEKIRAVITEETFQQAKEMIASDWGEFLAFGNSYLAEIRQMGKKTVVIQMNASYEKVSVTYTLNFDKNMNLIGLFMK